MRDQEGAEAPDDGGWPHRPSVDRRWQASGQLARFAALAADPRVEAIPALHGLAAHALEAAVAHCFARGLQEAALAVLVALPGDHPG